MTVIPIRCLSTSDLYLLGNNVAESARRKRLRKLRQHERVRKARMRRAARPTCGA